MRRGPERSVLPVTRSGSRAGPSVHPLSPSAGAVVVMLRVRPRGRHRPDVR
jgi:hypothetical protein